jgi:cytoskeletal protein CcmA (bactofilin family)
LDAPRSERQTGEKPMPEKQTSIGKGAHFKGKILNASAIEVSGTVEADVSTDKLTITESGQFNGAIKSKLVVVSGSYDGKMTADSVWLMTSSRVSGEIRYKSLQLDRGAALNCRVIQNWSEKTASRADSQEAGGAASKAGNKSAAKEK